MKPSFEKTHMAYAIRKGMTNYFVNNFSFFPNHISIKRLSDKTWTTTSTDLANNVLREITNISPKHHDLEVVPVTVGNYIEVK